MRLIVLALILVLAAPAAGAIEAQPSLDLVGSQPMLVRGAQFRPFEHVRVLINGAKFRSVNVQATARGGFSFPLRVAYDKCRGLIVQALGASGSHASVGILSGGCAQGLPQIPSIRP